MEMFEQWWEIAKLGSPVAVFIMGVAGIFLWRAYQGELQYSKSRDTQTLTALMDLTKVMENLEKQEDNLLRLHMESAKELSSTMTVSTDKLLATLKDMADLLRSHGVENTREFQLLKEHINKLRAP